ncbi:hypothetical protein [Dysgonomonas termitidis]|uniref:Uncharacterized protein n=1 Tax=Dysgonomonas termitidis TaxID=1516126 RepID=A0ABV9KT02_9BACT
MEYVIFVLHIQSQITAKYSIGYGSYNMSDMEKYMEDAKFALIMENYFQVYFLQE